MVILKKIHDTFFPFVKSINLSRKAEDKKTNEKHIKTTIINPFLPPVDIYIGVPCGFSL